MSVNVPPLPDRPREVVRGLPYPFARAQLDSAAPSYALTPQGVVVSTDAWSGRHLARPVASGWVPVTQGPLWHRSPRWISGGLVCEVYQDPADDHGALRSITVGTHGETANSAADRARAGTELPCPYQTSRVAVLLRHGGTGRVVCRDERQESVLDHVIELGPWLTRDELLVVKERWPSRDLYRWDLNTGRLHTIFGHGRRVVTDVRRSGELIGISRTSTSQPRRLELFECAGLVKRSHWLSNDQPQGPTPGPVRTVLVDGPVCTLPCLQYEPRDEPRGTIILLHGGPNGVNLATWSPLADSLTLAGWRLVLPNVRGSGVLDPRLRPPRPDRYGADDVDDVLAVIRHFAASLVIVGGRSYGGYLAARTAMTSSKVKAVFLLGGFLARTDLDETRHAGVAAFLRAAGHRFVTDRPPAPVPHFVAHGRRDDRIPIEAVTSHAERLASGSEMITLASEGHCMRTDPGARQAFPALFHWLEGLG